MIAPEAGTAKRVVHRIVSDNVSEFRSWEKQRTQNEARHNTWTVARLGVHRDKDKGFLDQNHRKLVRTPCMNACAEATTYASAVDSIVT